MTLWVCVTPRSIATRNPYDETFFNRYLIGIPRSCYSLGMTPGKMAFLPAGFSLRIDAHPLGCGYISPPNPHLSH
jgi:hypothetical protein